MRARVGIYSVAVAATVISFFPIIWLVLTSLKTSAGIYAYPPQYIPDPFTLEHYVSVLKNSPILLRYILNSMIVGLAPQRLY